MKAKFHPATICLAPLFWWASTAASGASPPFRCEATPTHHTISLGQPAAEHLDWLTRLIRTPLTQRVAPGETFGSHRFEQRLETGWTFTLLPRPFGWQIGLFSDDASSVDLTAITPPLSAALPNPRELAGWHFRNVENNGPNDGSVNAPQALRLFAFDPKSAGPKGFNRSKNGAPAPKALGQGWLRVLDTGLADLSTDKRARLTYLKFDGCLRWPRSAPQPITIDPTDQEMAAACGLDLNRFRLVSGSLTPALLQGDIDGDGAFDHIYRVSDRTSGETALALCRAGTWLSLLAAADHEEAIASTITSLERWKFVPGTFATPGDVAQGASWPNAAGDVLVLERLEKSLVLVYWENGLRLQPVFRLITE